MVNRRKKLACGTPDEEKRKRDTAVLEQLTELEKVRRRHNTTFVGQEEGDIADKASEELNKDIESAEQCLNERPKRKKAKLS